MAKDPLTIHSGKRLELHKFGDSIRCPLPSLENNLELMRTPMIFNYIHTLFSRILNKIGMKKCMNTIENQFLVLKMDECINGVCHQVLNAHFPSNFSKEIAQAQ